MNKVKEILSTKTAQLIIAGFLIAALLAIMMNLVFAIAAKAATSKRECSTNSQAVYVGFAGSPIHARLAELDSNGRGCQWGKPKDWKARDGKSTFSADITANSSSIMMGTEWHLKTPVRVDDGKWTTAWRVDGWFRECTVYQMTLCGPTGTFRYWLVYQTYGLTRFSGPTWYWKLKPTNNYAKLQLAVYTSP